MPCSTVTMRIAFAMFSLQMRTMAEAVSTRVEARARRRARRATRARERRVERELAAEEERGIEPAEHDVGVGDRRALAAAGRSRPGPGTAPALCGPTCRKPPGSTQPIEPPPAPIVRVETLGTLTGRPNSISKSEE